MNLLSALIAMILAFFTFLGAVAGEEALPRLQDAQDQVIAAIAEVTTQDENTNGDNGENGNGENGNGDENGEDENGNGDENGDGNGDSENGDENGNGEEPENNKVRAYNTAAGFVLPTKVPQRAIDRSVALISCDDPEADCEDTSPGNSDHSKNGNNGNGNGNNGGNGNGEEG